MGKFLEMLLQAIPEGTYDLIGRILPGGIVIAGVVTAQNLQIRSLFVGADVSALGVVVFCAFAYATGVAISTFTHLVHYVTWIALFPILRGTRIAARITSDLSKVANDNNLTLGWNPLTGENVLGYAHDCIKQRSPTERPVVTKLFAEVSLLYGLAIATIVALSLIGALGKHWPVPVAFFVAGFIRSLRTWYRHQSILNVVINAQR